MLTWAWRTVAWSLSIGWIGLGIGPLVAGAWPGAANPGEAELLRQQRRAAAQPTELWAPHYSVSGDDETMVYVLNETTDPIQVEAAAYSAGGERLPLGTFLVEPSQHIAFGLAETLREAEARFHEGSLSLAYLGDRESIQAWAVLNRGGQLLELPFKLPGDGAGTRFTSFWNAFVGQGAGSRPVFYFVNGGSREVTATVTAGVGLVQLDVQTRTMAPGEQWRYSPEAGSLPLLLGWLRFEHDGEPAAVTGRGALEGTSRLAALPWVETGASQGELEYDAIRLPRDGSQTARGAVTLFNPGIATLSVELEALALGSGLPLATRTVSLRSHQVKSVPLRLLLAGHEAGEEARLRVHGSAPFLVTGQGRLHTGEVIDLAFFPRGAGHGGGTYPLPDLELQDVFTTLVNVGQEAASIAVQVFWAGGAYAYGPVVVPGGGARRLEIDDIVQNGAPDVLGRRLPADYTHGVLKWLSQTDGTSLIARTEVRPRTGRDVFGFNCYGCCWEYPVGEVVPSSVEFLVGQSRSFQACVRYNTCNGTMGPYPTPVTSITSPPPFSWNGSTITASGVAYETQLFEGVALELTPSCQVQYRNFYGGGVASTCKQNLRKNHNPQEYWQVAPLCISQMAGVPAGQECASCTECSYDIFEYQKCTRIQLPIATAKLQSNLGNCLPRYCD